MNNNCKEQLKQFEKNLKDIAKYLSCNEEELINEVLPLVICLLQKQKEEIVKEIKTTIKELKEIYTSSEDIEAHTIIRLNNLINKLK